MRERISMSFSETLKLIQFRAAYNLPVHAGIETGIFARHDLRVEMAYTPGSLYISQALEEGRFDIGHTGADDVIAAVETNDSSDLFLFMGLHSGLFSLVGSPDCASIDSLFGKSIGVDAKTSGFALVLESLLHSRGFSREDYQLIRNRWLGTPLPCVIGRKNLRDSVNRTFRGECAGGGLSPAC